MNAIVPRATVETIVAARNAALELFAVAHDRLAEAEAAVDEAHAMARQVHPGENGLNYPQAKEVEAFQKAIRLPPRSDYLRTAKKLIDCDAWSYIIERTALTKLMDREAKDKLRAQMAYVPDRVDRDGQLITGDEVEKGMPELTVENVEATLERFFAESETIFRRGLANCFSALDRRFKSHDGFKIGSRIILTRVCNDWGHFDYGRRRDEIHDVERVFYVLDGKPEPDAGMAWQIDSERRAWPTRASLAPFASTHEGPYMRIEIYKNGNAHLWFTRRDLVERVNRILAEHYGEVIGDGRTAEADPFAEIKRTPAKRFGFFPTPDQAAEIVLDGVWKMQGAEKPPLRVLEPSAGTGQLAKRMVTSLEESTRNWSGYRSPEQMERWRREYRFDNVVDCVEIQGSLAAQLRQAGIYNRVYEMDFLALTPATTGLYDVIVMNPPFDLERDIDHVIHALKFLRPGGQLTAIMSAGTEFRETKKATAFRALMSSMGAKWRDLPPGSFAEVGTYVNTCFVRVTKP